MDVHPDDPVLGAQGEVRSVGSERDLMTPAWSLMDWMGALHAGTTTHTCSLSSHAPIRYNYACHGDMWAARCCQGNEWMGRLLDESGQGPFLLHLVAAPPPKHYPRDPDPEIRKQMPLGTTCLTHVCVTF